MPEERKASRWPSLVLFGLMILCMLAVFWPPLLGWEGDIWRALPYAALVLLVVLLIVNVLRLRALRRARGGSGRGR